MGTLHSLFLSLLFLGCSSSSDSESDIDQQPEENLKKRNQR